MLEDKTLIGAMVEIDADSITLVVSREKDGKSRLVFAGWDDVSRTAAGKLAAGGRATPPSGAGIGGKHEVIFGQGHFAMKSEARSRPLNHRKSDSYTHYASAL